MSTQIYILIDLICICSTIKKFSHIGYFHLAVWTSIFVVFFIYIYKNYHEIYAHAVNSRLIEIALFFYRIKESLLFLLLSHIGAISRYSIVLCDSLKLKTVNASDRGENPKLTLWIITENLQADYRLQRDCVCEREKKIVAIIIVRVLFFTIPPRTNYFK